MGGGPRLRREYPHQKGVLVSDRSEFARVCEAKVKDLHERARARGYWSLDELAERIQMLRLQHGGESAIRGSFFIMPAGEKENGVQVVLEYQYLEKFNMERIRKSYGRRTKENYAKDDPPDPRASEEKR